MRLAALAAFVFFALLVSRSPAEVGKPQTAAPEPQKASGESSPAFVTSITSPRTERDEEKVQAEEEPHQQSDRAELNRIIEMYMAGDYKACSQELSVFLDSTSPRAFTDQDDIERGRLYFASCSLLDGQREEARAALLLALQNNPLMQSPDSLTFPPPVVSLFYEVRDEVQQLIADSEKEQVVRLRRENEIARRKAEERERRERDLEKLAQQEFVVVKNSRFLASIPFGVGQFQNGKNGLGALFLATEVLLLGTAVTSGIVLENLAGAASAEDGQVVNWEQHNSRKSAAYTTLTWSSWALLGVAGLGVLEAHLNFKPERQLEVRERPLPPDLRGGDEEDEGRDEQSRKVHLTPVVAAHPGGGFLGVNGTF